MDKKRIKTELLVHDLGLAGILILIEDMGDRIYLESGEGKGCQVLRKNTTE